MDVSELAKNITRKLGLENLPIGMYFSESRPDNAIGFTTKGNGCIIPLIYSSAKGKTVVIDKDTTGWNCSAFYLGYQEWIFEGIECFLSDGIVNGRPSERFIKTEKQAKSFVEMYKPHTINHKKTIFKPLTEFKEKESPELVIFFVNPDQLSALVYLLHFNAPERTDIIVSGFVSGCGSIITLPMKLQREGKKQAVWGMHDVSVRKRLPKDLMTLTMPYELLVAINNDIDISFIITENWTALKDRNNSN
jgi:uncharacterized protein (DUF169 family)